jgi:hypothetical protein
MHRPQRAIPIKKKRSYVDEILLLNNSKLSDALKFIAQASPQQEIIGKHRMIRVKRVRELCISQVVSD